MKIKFQRELKRNNQKKQIIHMSMAIILLYFMKSKNAKKMILAKSVSRTTSSKFLINGKK